MSEEPDQESKTEEASEKKIRDALEKGNVPHSRELVVFGSLMGMMAAGYFLVREQSQRFASGLQSYLAQAGSREITAGADAVKIIMDATLVALAFALPVMLLMMAFGVVASLAQGKPSLVLDRIIPKASRISPAAGFKRMFGLRGQVEFAKTSIKFIAVSLIALLVVQQERKSLDDLLLLEAWQIPDRALEIGQKLINSLAIAALLIVIADMFWSRIQWRRDLRMTRKELQDEYKDSEGDPIFKARRRSIALQRRRNRMMSAVPSATLVVTNPTHFAVALKYVKGETPAPVVVAKGLDKLALRIRAAAESHGIPVIEDRLLARSLYKAVEVDQIIRPEFYHAVAELILMVQRRGAWEPNT
ncbi:MAG: flagellar biosynthesis protein FlhB [Beijerinckiaceae bacterium]